MLSTSWFTDFRFTPESGHRLDILNTLFLSAYLYQSIIEVLRLFAKFHE